MKSDRFEIHVGDCLETLKTMADNSVDACVTDPPYGIRFMGAAWDGKDIEARTAARRAHESHAPGAGPNGGHKSIAAEAGKYDLTPSGMLAFQEFSRDWATEVLRVLKPGGHLLSFSSARTYHQMACGIEAAGFEIRDQIMWIFGSGFPKSHNLQGDYSGWGTALKPAHEPICVARKPFKGTVASNVIAHGTGALNIDGCRVDPTGERLGGGGERKAKFEKSEGWSRPWMSDPDHVASHAAKVEANVDKATALGRWPANLLHDGSEEVVALFPSDAGASAPVKGTELSLASAGAITGKRDRVEGAFHGDKGSAARFFYAAKTSSSDRHEGLEHPGHQFKFGSTLRDAENLPAERKGNTHPTVKPTDLMAYLCRLVTPQGGTVLDPFTGSGSTGKAAMREGFNFIGCEIDQNYADIAYARISYELAKQKEASQQADMFDTPNEATL